jgi:hypothetical protein
MDRPCACGCGRLVDTFDGGRIYFERACSVRVYDRRRVNGGRARPREVKSLPPYGQRVAEEWERIKDAEFARERSECAREAARARKWRKS